MKKLKYNNGEKVGNYGVTLVKYSEKYDVDKAKFSCPKCFTEFVTRIYSIEQGHTKSCGCIRVAVSKARKVVLNEKLIKAVEADIKENILTIKAMSSKHSLSLARIDKLKRNYYARL